MKLKQHVFLTGFMGSGKTTAGKKLATFLKILFIDLDEYIEKKTLQDIQSIFEAHGEAKFREIETECLNEILALKKPHIISLGGGTICFGSNLEAVKQKGTLVYIELEPSVLAERIRTSKTVRPLLKNLSEEELLKNIEEILTQRKPFYLQAHLVINGLLLTPQFLYQKLLASTSTNIN